MSDPQACVIGAEPGVVAWVLPLGATVQRLEATCGDGVRRNLVLGHGRAEDYATGRDYVGGVVGRFANRIAHGRFRLDGREVQAEVVDGLDHALHGDPHGFHRRAWDVVSHDRDHVALRLVSPDGDQGLPGRLTVEATYRVDGTTLSLSLRATTDAPTVVNLAAHPYFTLDDSADVLGHHLQVAASRFLPTDATGIPLGAPVEVAGTPFDLRDAVAIGDAVTSDHPQVRAAGGLDHTLVLGRVLDGVRPVAVVSSVTSATTLQVATDQPGLQVYTGGSFDGSSTDVEGRALQRHAGLALEAQRFPDSPHHADDPAYPSCVLRPGETYTSRTSWTVGRLDPLNHRNRSTT